MKIPINNYTYGKLLTILAAILDALANIFHLFGSPENIDKSKNQRPSKFQHFSDSPLQCFI